MMQKASGVPTLYSVLEYLESSGTQVIDTGQYAKLNSKFIADALYIPGNQGGYAYILGCYNPLVAPLVISTSTYPSQSNSYSSFGNISDKATDKACLPYIRGIITLDKNSCEVIYSGMDSTKSIATLNATSLTENQNSHICLFARGNNGAYERFSKCRIYEYWYYEGDTLVQHMVPVIRNTDTKPGMYDTVSGTFYTNAGTGEFTVPA